ncbi:GNAT family N-acetyltransferase [Nocardia sp. alder85J]|uniref:GNAT family N-acetyltransferase n=1 Tax=Nocardia sp. alder85J TaxID=2862949 RepID=UPI001CD76464|nr:GNAT family N-acetyltransferase [Nocardia sp. alder85J]MCX4094793.1 GNAT family N-acetyltransferase [Nocardia sp. alder85J]
MSEQPIDTAERSPAEVVVDRAGLWDAESLSDVAAATFPLACPPDLTATDIAAFIADALSGDRFGDYLTDPHRTVLKAVTDTDIVGYAMLVAGEPADPDVASAVRGRPALELDKMYVLPGHHGGEVSGALMRAAVDAARHAGCAGLWLGVNQENVRAQRFYAKHGFEIVGTRTFTVGTRLCRDYVMQKTI